MKVVESDRSPGHLFTETTIIVNVYQCLRFVHLGLRSILVLFEQVKTDEDEVLVNVYQPSWYIL